jgi:membrane-associated phospholipid phosphatase
LKFVLLVLATGWAHNIWGQQAKKAGSDAIALGEAPSSPPVETDRDYGKAPGNFQRLLVDFGKDQKQIWTSPARIRFSDATWLVPFAGLTAGLLATDRQYSASLSNSPGTMNHYKTISNAGVAGLVGAGAGMYLMSFPTHNEHWRETGLLAGEAAINSLVVTETFKYSLGRQRPYQGSGAGAFFQGGTSFPSEHSAAAWSIAGVIAHEYPGVLPKLFAYGAAAAVDYSRIHGRQHFPSDVLVGSVLGYLVAESVYRRHARPELLGRAWEPPSEFVSEEKSHSSAYMGSPYISLDSWVYPAIERLAALGYAGTASAGLRPWTRLECARLVSEAGERGADSDGPPEVQRLYGALADEFAHEFELMNGEQNLVARVESIYSRSLGISGEPLTDNLHFGQTLLNDYGRPYEQGFSATDGASGWTAMGPFVIYARGEYQSTGPAPSVPRSALDFISNTDALPPNAPSTPTAAIHRFRLLDAYVGMSLANWQFSYGRRSLWWGPSEGGPMLFTNNGGPLDNMFTVDRVSPFRLPWLFRYLGDIRVQAFLGQLSGQEFLSTTFSGTTGPAIGRYGHELNPQPFLSGGKVSFKFTSNFEFNLSKTTLYGGPGNPLTILTLLQSTFGKHVHGDVLGDGRTAVDFSYRIPKLRNWLTMYGEAMSEDEISPIAYPAKSAFQGGVYLAKLPAMARVDLRLEGGSTDAPSFCNRCFYWNSQYVSGYTNNGRLIGSWIGRAAQGELIRTTYWLSPRSRIGVELRHRKSDLTSLPQGGTQNDVGLNADIFAGPGFRFSGRVQYERWQIPLLATGPQSNVAASFQFSFWPAGHAR